MDGLRRRNFNCDSTILIWTRKLAMEFDRNRAITKLKMMILVRENDKKRLQAVIAFTQSAERRTEAIGELASILNEIEAATDELARLKAGLS